MKKTTLTVTVILITISNTFAQVYDEAGKKIIKQEVPKIQYVFEGEIVKVEMYAGDFDGTRLTGKDIVWDESSLSYSYRQLKDGGGPVCFSIASIKICQNYKGLKNIDTIKIVTGVRDYKFLIEFKGADTLIECYKSTHSSGPAVFNEPFIPGGMKGYKGIFFAYNHNFPAVSNQIKTVSTIGHIIFHNVRWNTKSYDPSDWIFASNAGPLVFARLVFYSRKEINQFLKDLHIRGLRVKSRNNCITEKEKTMKPRIPENKDNPNNSHVY